MCMCWQRYCTATVHSSNKHDHHTVQLNEDIFSTQYCTQYAKLPGYWIQGIVPVGAEVLAEVEVLCFNCHGRFGYSHGLQWPMTW